MRVCGAVEALISTFDTRSRWRVSVTPWPLSLLEKSVRWPLNRKLVSSQRCFGLFGKETKKSVGLLEFEMWLLGHRTSSLLCHGFPASTNTKKKTSLFCPHINLTRHRVQADGWTRLIAAKMNFGEVFLFIHLDLFTVSILFTHHSIIFVSSATR